MSVRRLSSIGVLFEPGGYFDMGKRVLITDDALFMRVTLKKILTASGYEIAGEASNGRESIALFQETKPDLITMDITMPEMDGFELARQARASRPSLPIIYLTGYSNLLTEGTVEIFGPILRKPYHRDDLTRQIEELLTKAEDADLVRVVAMELLQRDPNAFENAKEAEELALAQGDLLSAEAWRDIAAAITVLAGNSGPRGCKVTLSRNRTDRVCTRWMALWVWVVARNSDACRCCHEGRLGPCGSQRRHPQVRLPRDAVVRRTREGRQSTPTQTLTFDAAKGLIWGRSAASPGKTEGLL
jgi:two-component system chemotaxis response regulator CheY